LTNTKTVPWIKQNQGKKDLWTWNKHSHTRRTSGHVIFMRAIQTMQRRKGNVERTAHSSSVTRTYSCASSPNTHFSLGKSAALKLYCKKKSSTDIYFFVALQY
jgi:hypothetical protein